MNTEQFIHHFRHSLPYINAFRSRIFVIQISGETFNSPRFHGLIHDIALLNSLGCQIVLVFDASPQISTQLKHANLPLEYIQHHPIIPEQSLQQIKSTLGLLRFDIEAAFSTGLKNSPMANSPLAGSAINIISGNFVYARPIGIIDGIDCQHSGTVRRIDTRSILDNLNTQDIILLSPLGYSPTGELFYLSAEELACQCAIQLNADKLIFISEKFNFFDNQLTRQFSVSEAIHQLDNHHFPNASVPLINTAISACQQGISRTHLLAENIEGALLQELFTVDGIGTLINADVYENTRTAVIDDIVGIKTLIQPLEQQGILVERSRERLEREIEHFIVIERDGFIIGCVALFLYPDSHIGELACLVIHPDYRQQKRGEHLLAFLEQNARQQGCQQLITLTTQTAHWFVEKGFQQINQQQLPEFRKKLYNYQRNSKALMKTL